MSSLIALRRATALHGVPWHVAVSSARLARPALAFRRGYVGTEPQRDTRSSTLEAWKADALRAAEAEAEARKRREAEAERERQQQLEWESDVELPPRPQPGAPRRPKRPTPGAAVKPATGKAAAGAAPSVDSAQPGASNAGKDALIPATDGALPANVPKEELWPKVKRIVKEGALHYWHGTKLLYYEIKTTIGIVRRITKGHTMTRRERRQLIRTTSDLLRVIPFSVFIIVPFMEFLLPVALKLFPNMLPSTFEDKLKKEENMKKKLKLRLELAKFLQDTAEQLAVHQSGASGRSFNDLMHRIRANEQISNEEILKFATAFRDEFTLDNVSRVQLVAMCRYMGLPPYGSDGLLKFQLERKLRQLKLDDQMIRSEGVNTLSLEELQQALRARGMRGTSMSKTVLRKRLNEWLTLSLDHRIPESLLILTRAFVINESDHLEGALKDTLSALPEQVLEEVSADMDGTQAPELKLEVLQHQNEQITQELDELLAKKSRGLLTDSDVAKELELTERLKGIGQAISWLSQTSAVSEERSDLAELKAEREQMKAEREAQAKAEQPAEQPLPVPAAAQPAQAAPKKEKEKSSADARLDAKLESMVSELEKELEIVEREVGNKLAALGIRLDLDKDGMVSTSELAAAVEQLRSKLTPDEIQTLDRDRDDKISLEELIAYYEHRQPPNTPGKESSGKESAAASSKDAAASNNS